MNEILDQLTEYLKESDCYDLKPCSLKLGNSTLKMSDIGARIMGGMTKEEAREVIQKLTGKTPREA